MPPLLPSPPPSTPSSPTSASNSTPSTLPSSAPSSPPPSVPALRPPSTTHAPTSLTPSPSPSTTSSTLIPTSSSSMTLSTSRMPPSILMLPSPFNDAEVAALCYLSRQLVGLRHSPDLTICTDAVIVVAIVAGASTQVGAARATAGENRGAPRASPGPKKLAALWPALFAAGCLAFVLLLLLFASGADPHQIAMRYLKENFAIDFIAMLPIPQVKIFPSFCIVLCI